MAVEIKPSVLREQVEQGMKLDTLVEYYGLPKSQMKKALQQLGLKIRRFHEPKFVIVEENEQAHHNTPHTDNIVRPEFPITPQNNTAVERSSYDSDRGDEERAGGW